MSQWATLAHSKEKITTATLDRKNLTKLPELDRRTGDARVRAARNEAMLVALRELCALPREGKPMSRHAIASVTGFHPENIRLIERSALRKMRNRLPPEVREAFDEFLAKDRSDSQPKKTRNEKT